MNKNLEELVLEKSKLTREIRECSKEKSEKKQLLINECKTLIEKIKELQPPKDPILHAKMVEKKKNRITAECADCGGEYDVSSKTRVPIAYCKPCRANRTSDILEYISGEEFQIFSEKDLGEAEEFLRGKCADLRLDLHKTLDSISAKTKLPTSSACCVSYVGCLTETRIAAREDIMDRIRKGQILFGVLIFKRGSARMTDDERNSFTSVGSKAWFNLLCKYSTKPLFIDDSEDHVLSVRSIGVESIQIKSGQNLLNLIRNRIK